jgi:uncharacterized protein YndB with AHSA1/START domain
VEPLELAFTVECSPEHAFDTWARRIGTWWPKGHSVSADPGLAVTLEPRVGGRIYETTPGGTEHDWGEVLTWDPPHRLRYLWHLRADRADATEVEVAFTAEAGHTLVTIVHSGWERLGERAEAWRDRNQRGWAGLLGHYRAACSVTL